MTDLTKKLSFAQNLSSAVQNVVDQTMSMYGNQLPCTVVETDGRFVTVNFEVVNTTLPLPQITIPIAGWQWMRYPVQVGDAGVTVSIDVNVAFIAHVVNGKTTMVPSGNFGPTLLFLPVMQKDMFTAPDPNALIGYGPNGVQLFDYDPTKQPDENINSLLKVTPTSVNIILKSGIAINISGDTISIEASNVNIMGDVTISGILKAGGIEFNTHYHSDPQGGNTGGPAS